MANTLFKMINATTVAAALLLGTATANAQSAYMGDNSHYLTLPQGYQQAAQQPSSGRPAFTGQGMGQGQLQQAATPAMAQPQPITQASTRMLPQGYAPQATSQMNNPATGNTQAVVMQPNPVAFPLAKPIVQPATIQAASVPSAQTLAAMEPAAGSASNPSTNVGLASGCDGRADNHRQHKGINTSTTVGNACFN